MRGLTLLCAAAFAAVVLSGCLQAKVSWPNEDGNAITAEYKAVLWTTEVEDFIYDQESGTISLGNYTSKSDEKSIEVLSEEVAKMTEKLTEILLLLK